MRKTLIAALFAATLPALALAAAPGHDGGKHDGGFHHMQAFKGLDLTREQRRELHELMSQQMKSRHEITQRYLEKLPEAERKAMQQELVAAREANRKAVRDLLTPEQQKTFDERQKKMEERRAERAEFLKWKAEKDKA